MRTLTALIHPGESDEGGFWATCLEVPGANGQGETREECLQNLAEAVKLILEVNEEEALREHPGAEKASLAVA
jgi:predicted RNase H-like HicB family nuclease